MRSIGSIKVAAGVIVVAGLLGAASASADYMSECDALIGAWNACRAAGADCAAAEQAIVDRCRCHERRGDRWVFNEGSLDSGVCNAPTSTTIIIPPPPPPPPTNIREADPRGGDGGPRRHDQGRNGGDDGSDGDGDGQGRGDDGGSAMRSDNGGAGASVSSSAAARPATAEVRPATAD